VSLVLEKTISDVPIKEVSPASRVSCKTTSMIDGEPTTKGVLSTKVSVETTAAWP
jgi:hypothetical protein